MLGLGKWFKTKMNVGGGRKDNVDRRGNCYPYSGGTSIQYPREMVLSQNEGNGSPLSISTSSHLLQPPSTIQACLTICSIQILKRLY